MRRDACEAVRLCVEYTIDLVSEANVHGPMRAAMNRTKRHREAAKMWLESAARAQNLWPKPPCTITLTRYGIRRIDGHDGLGRAFKATIDGIACKGTIRRKPLVPGQRPHTRPPGFLLIDDGDPRLTWVLTQQIVPRMEIGPIRGQSRVRIEIEWSDQNEQRSA